MILSPDISSSLKVAVTATRAEFASTMGVHEYWVFTSSTNCWIKQANPTGTITCVAKASLADTDYMTINDGINAAVLYEFDTVGDGGTGGRVIVNVSAATTAADVAVLLKAAIEANQTYLTVTHNGSGVLTLTATSRNITLTENVTNAGFLVSYTPQATAAALSMYVPANAQVILDGRLGSNLSVLRDAADGSATLTKMLSF
jgi:phage tail sheath gpL-like